LRRLFVEHGLHQNHQATPSCAPFTGALNRHVWPCTACSEKYDALVMRLMVVVARAAVAAEELDKAVKADKGNPDSSSHLKPGVS